MLPNVFALLNVTAIRAYVRENGITRIFRHGRAPQDVKAPYITWYVIDAIPENHLDGTPPVDSCSVQVDIWSNNTGTGSEQAVTLATAVRDQIETAHHITSFGGDSQESETQRFRQTIIFTFWNNRT